MQGYKSLRKEKNSEEGVGGMNKKRNVKLSLNTGSYYS